MPPRDPEPAISRRKSETKFDIPEPELAGMLEKYCDMRRRGFTQAAIRPHPHVDQLLLQKFGMRPKRVDGNRAKFMSRRLRENEYSPALIRKALEHLGVDPDTYYMIGPDYRIPEPSEEGKARCIQALQKAGFSDETIESALATLGVPPGGRHPPKRSSKKYA